MTAASLANAASAPTGGLVASVQKPSLLHGFAERLGREWRALEAILTGKRSPLANSSTAENGNVSEFEQTATQAERVAQYKRNSEILHELWVVTLLQEPSSGAVFGGWLQSLNQGASLEGIYNGLIHTQEYRHREEAAKSPASAAALQVFVEEWSILRAEREAEGKGKPEATADAIAEWRNQAQNFYLKASLLTLKRELGDEALRLIAVKRKKPERLAFWYSRWATRLARKKTPFGLKSRERPDVPFHYAWALEDPQEMRQDLLTWEVLNRLHRLLNQTGGSS